MDEEHYQLHWEFFKSVNPKADEMFFVDLQLTKLNKLIQQGLINIDFSNDDTRTSKGYLNDMERTNFFEQKDYILLLEQKKTNHLKAHFNKVKKTKNSKGLIKFFTEIQTITDFEIKEQLDLFIKNDYSKYNLFLIEIFRFYSQEINKNLQINFIEGTNEIDKTNFEKSFFTFFEIKDNALIECKLNFKIDNKANSQNKTLHNIFDSLENLEELILKKANEILELTKNKPQQPETSTLNIPENNQNNNDFKIETLKKNVPDLIQETNRSATDLFYYLVENYRYNENKSVVFCNIWHFLKKDANKTKFTFKITQENYKNFILLNFKKQIKKFAKNDLYTEAEKPILESLETAFLKSLNL